MPGSWTGSERMGAVWGVLGLPDIAAEMRSGGIPGACRLWGLPGQPGGRDPCTWENPQHEDAQPAVASSLNVECEDQGLTPCLKGLSTHRSAHLPQQQAPCQAALWFIPCSQQCWHTVQGWVPTAACSVWALFSSPRRFVAIAHVHEKIPDPWGLMPKAVTDGRAVNTLYALNLAILHILTCVFLWTLMLCRQGWCSPDTTPDCHKTTPSLFLPWLHLFFVHLQEPRPRVSAHLLKWIDW